MLLNKRLEIIKRGLIKRTSINTLKQYNVLLFKWFFKKSTKV